MVFLKRDIQECTKKLSYVTPILTWKLNWIETPSASDYIITMFLLTLPWSPLHYQYPPGGGNCVTKIAPKSYQDLRYFCRSIYYSFVKFYHKFGYHIETITNDRPIPSVKHVKHNAKEYKSRCKHPYRLLPSPSWIMVTHSDLGNEFPFRYRA